MMSLWFTISNFEFVSHFEIRISDFMLGRAWSCKEPKLWAAT